MLTRVQGLPEQRVLEQMGIRTMAKAVYTSKNIGHYGLGFEHYCHFTSPIRRYPDILVHRVLTGILGNDPTADKKWSKNASIPVKGREQQWNLKEQPINTSRLNS